MEGKKGSIRVVMFDLGNVLICFDHMIAARKIENYSDKDARQIYALFFSLPVTEQFDRGLIDEKSFFEGVKKLLNLNGLSRDEFYNIWNNIFWENPGLKELIKEIKETYEKFLIISNVNKPHFEYIRDKFPIITEADGIILSYEIGVLKPDPRIYNAAVEKAGCLPSEIFYTDDREDLIEAAVKLGFKARLFQGISDIRRYLF